MKKILTLVLVLTMMFALAVPAMATVNITANKFTPALDGVKDEAYAGPVDIATPNRDADGELTGVGAAGATGKSWVAWDDSALYFYIEVYDKTPNHDDFNAESVEIFLDWNAGKGEADEAWDDKPFWQVRVGPVDPEELSGYWRDEGGAHWDQEDFEELTEWKLIPIDGDYKNGYIIEIKIGAPAVAPLSEGKQIPFDLQVCDNSQGDGRDGQMFLDHVGEGIDDNSRWNTSMHLQGLLTLGGVYVPPAAGGSDEMDDDAPGANDGGNLGGDDDVVVTTPPAGNTGGGAVNTGDNGLILLVLAIVLAGAVVMVKRTGKNKA